MDMQTTSGYRPMLWAKTHPESGLPALTVRDHCLNVGAVGKVLSPLLPVPVRRLLPEGAVTLCAAHDIGKITPGFLEKSPHWRSCDPASLPGGITRHAVVSQWFLGRVPDMKVGPRFSAWAMAAGGHHGSYPSHEPVILEEIHENYTTPWPERERLALLEELKELFGPLPAEPMPRPSCQVHLLTGFVTFCDWLGSDENTFPLDDSLPLVDRASLPASEAAARGVLEAMGFHRREVRSGLEFPRLFASPGGTGEEFTLRPLQEALIRAVDEPGLYIVEAPMGMGKTEAALAAAYRRWNEPDGERGLYFALPTQLTSRRIHDRVAVFLKNAIADPAAHALVHGNAWLLPGQTLRLSPAGDGEGDAGAAEALPWFASTRKALLAPYGTGTIDQALLAVLPAKHAALRYFALAGKVVVFDEVHSYDPYTSALVDRAIHWLLRAGCSVIVLSATLTASRRASLVAAATDCKEETTPDAYPLITKVSAAGGVPRHIPVMDGARESRNVEVRGHSANDNGVWDMAVAAAESGACVLVIRNTVALAQETFRRLKSACRDAGFPVGLLHSRFIQAERDAREERWTALLGKGEAGRPNGCLLIATQVVEQSVDIDADLLITDLAPSDLLLQRVGRLHRHRRVRPEGFQTPVCHILYPDVDWSADTEALKAALKPHGSVYPPYALYRAARVWSARSAISLPGEIRGLLEITYNETEELPAGVGKLKEDMLKKAGEMTRTATARDVFRAAGLEDMEGVQTRWNNQQSALLVLLRAAPETRGARVRLRFTDGSPPFEADIHRFDMELARKLHAHAVRLPLHLVRHAMSRQPEWFTRHIRGAVIGVLPEGSTLCTLPDAPEGGAVLHYHPEQGLSCERPERKTPVLPAEPEEDGWF